MQLHSLTATNKHNHPVINNTQSAAHSGFCNSSDAIDNIFVDNISLNLSLTIDGLSDHDAQILTSLYIRKILYLQNKHNALITIQQKTLHVRCSNVPSSGSSPTTNIWKSNQNLLLIDRLPDYGTLLPKHVAVGT